MRKILHFLLSQLRIRNHELLNTSFNIPREWFLDCGNNLYQVNLSRSMKQIRLLLLFSILTLFSSLSLKAQIYNLSLTMSSDKSTAVLGDNVKFRVVVHNLAKTTVTGVNVSFPIPSTGVLASNTPSVGNYNGGTGIWTIGQIDGTTDSVTLDLNITVQSDGITFATAEISSMDQTDANSIPGNGSFIEDDISSACVSVPIHFNCSEIIYVLASAPKGFSNYQWYKNGKAIAGATLDTLRIVDTGSYNYTAIVSGANCPASLCCPIKVVQDACQSLGNLVFNDINNNGVHDVNEPGIPNLSLTLFSVGPDGVKGTADDSLMNTTTTDATGKYLFTGLDNGTYYVKFSVPTNMLSSTGNGPYDVSGFGAFEPSVSSKNDEDHGTTMTGTTMVMSDIVTLTLSGNPVNDGDTDANTNLSIDFGLYTPIIPKCAEKLIIGNLIWSDDNNNGIVDNGEKGIPSIKVFLHLIYKNGAGKLVDTIVGKTTTDSIGNYFFYCIDPGTYYVHFTPPTGTLSSTGNGTTSKNPHGNYEPAPISTGDNNDKGSTFSGTTIQSDTFSLSKTTNPSLNGSANLNIDFGIYKPKCTTVHPDFTYQVACLNAPVTFTPLATNNLNNWWDLGDGSITYDSTAFNHLYTTPGNYLVRYVVVDSNLCSGIISHIVNVQPMVWANAGLDKTICQGDSVQLGAQGGTHYKWTAISGQLSGSLNATNVFNPIATPNVTTTYVVAVSNDYACTSYDTVVVNVNTQPIVITPVVPLSTCTGGAIPVTVTIDQPISNYKILGSAGYKNVVVNGATIKFDAVLNGTYDNIIVTLAGATGCSVTTTFPIFLAGNPEADFVVIEPFCANNETTLLFTGDATPGAVLTYTVGDGTIVYQSPATATLPKGDTTIVKWANWGSKLVKLNVNDGGCQDNKTESIFVRKSPKTVLANSDTTVCPNTSIQLYGTAGLLTCVYKWTAVEMQSGNAVTLPVDNVAGITVTPTVTTVYTLTITDINGCQSSMSVKITVDTTKPIFKGVPADVTVECGHVPTVPIVVATNNGVVINTVTYIETRTDGNCLNNYKLIRTWTATNKCGLTTTARQIITIQDVTPPVFANVPQNVTVNCSDNVPYVITPTATDNCSGVVSITFAQTTQDSTCIGNKTIVRTWTATDACDNKAIAKQTITVQDKVPPVFANIPAPVIIECSDALPTAQPTATDACSQVTITSKDSTQVVDPCNKIITRTWSAIDACGNIATATQIITIRDTKAPVFNNDVPKALTVSCDANIPAVTTPTAIDNCDASPKITFSEVRDNQGTCLSHITRTWVATDKCGNAASAIQIITIRDTVPPVITPTHALLAGHASGDTISMSCDNLVVLDSSAVSAADNCNMAFIKFVDLGKKRGVCSRDGYSILLECSWEATDKCGNKSVYIIFIKVVDNKAPVLSAAPANITVNSEQEIPAAAVLTATDNCTENVPVVETENKVATGVDCDYILTRTWTATDSCNNKATVTQQILVHKNITVKAVPFAETCARNDGSISVIPTNGTYVWSDGGTGATRLNLKAGTYTVTATFGGCVKMLTATIGDSCSNPNPCITPVVTAQTVTATCGASNGSVTIGVDNAANYNYAWSANIPAGTGNTRGNLAAGNYSVTVSRANLATCSTVVNFTIGNNTSNCCTNFIAQTTVVKTITDCAAKADVCVEIPSNSINTYTITDNKAIYTDGFGTCNAGSTLHLGVGEHNLIFISLTGCKDTLGVKVVCIAANPSIVVQKDIVVGEIGTYCPTVADLGVSGTITTIVNNCTPVGNVTFVYDTANKCIAYIGTNPGIDSACLTVTTSTGSSVNVSLIITITPQRFVCAPFLTSHAVTITSGCIGDSAKVCVDIPMDNITDYNITVNNVKYGSTYEGCKFDTTTTYQYYAIPGRGTAGPYRLDYWAFNGDTIRNKNFVAISDLVDYMNVWDATGQWSLVPSQLTIKGGDNAKKYGNIRVTQLSTFSYSIMQFNREYVPKGTYLKVKSGSSKIVFTNKSTGCTDSLTSAIACFAPTYTDMNLVQGTLDTMCLKTTHLLGSHYMVTNSCQGTGQYVTFALVPGTTCITCHAKSIGTEATCFVITDEYGIHDTTFVTVHVQALVTAARRPKAVDDAVSTVKSKPIMIDVLANDSISGTNITLKIINAPAHGELTLTADRKVIYTPQDAYCNSTIPDKFSYQICNTIGCDLATVSVTVICDKLKIYNAFSPNSDGVNDFFTIEGIEKYPNNALTIYNRYGAQVHNVKSYKNDWEGTWNGKVLPDGTYFYIFNDGEGNSYSGYVQINR